MPTCALLHRLLQPQAFSNTPTSTRFTVADYNHAVVALATAPNILLACVTADAPNIPLAEATDLDATPELLSAVREKLSRANIDVRAISGAWGTAFENLCSFPQSKGSTSETRPRTALFLASETIYSPASITSFTSTLLTLMRKAAAVENTHCIAYVAAKQFYFGVGGGIDDFLLAAQKFGASVQTVWSSAVREASGDGRCIVEVCLFG